MIQRLQSLWLLLAAACCILTLTLPLYDSNAPAAPGSALTYTAKDNLLMLILEVVTALGAVITIFLYKDRKLQLRITILLTLLSIVDIVLLMKMKEAYNDSHFTLSSAVCFAAPILFLLAARGISRDIRLIKSLDRLR